MARKRLCEELEGCLLQNFDNIAVRKIPCATLPTGPEGQSGQVGTVFWGIF